MDKDNTVYLLIGQRGAGKSHYAAKIIKNQPIFSLISRDAILIRLFGSINTDAYSGKLDYAHGIMEEELEKKLSAQTGLRIILDSWTQDSSGRKYLIRMLREFGATKIVALYFITPLEKVDIWFWQKPEIGKIEEMRARQGQGLVFFLKEAPAHDFKAFHQLAADIDRDGFDKVIRIDPLSEPIILV